MWIQFARSQCRQHSRRAKRAGVIGPYGTHSFRHGFAKAYLLHGGDLGTLADIMGHSSVEVTKNYGIFVLEELKEKHRQHSPMRGLLTDEENDVG